MKSSIQLSSVSLKVASIALVLFVTSLFFWPQDAVGFALQIFVIMSLPTLIVSSIRPLMLRDGLWITVVFGCMLTLSFVVLLNFSVLDETSFLFVYILMHFVTLGLAILNRRKVMYPSEKSHLMRRFLNRIHNTNFFFVGLDPRSKTDIFLWWELRRIPYNVIVFGYGIFAYLLFVTAIVAAGLPSGEDAEEPLGLFFGTIFFMFMTNVCYSLGWIFEIWLAIRGLQSPKLAPDLMKAGLLLNFLVVSLPAIIWGAILIATFFGFQPFHP